MWTMDEQSPSQERRRELTISRQCASSLTCAGVVCITNWRCWAVGSAHSSCLCLQHFMSGSCFAYLPSRISNKRGSGCLVLCIIYKLLHALIVLSFINMRDAALCLVIVFMMLFCTGTYLLSWDFFLILTIWSWYTVPRTLSDFCPLL